jgi:hypothetical protein
MCFIVIGDSVLEHDRLNLRRWTFLWLRFGIGSEKRHDKTRIKLKHLKHCSVELLHRKIMKYIYMR